MKPLGYFPWWFGVYLLCSVSCICSLSCCSWEASLVSFLEVFSFRCLLSTDLFRCFGQAYRIPVSSDLKVAKKISPLKFHLQILPVRHKCCYKLTFWTGKRILFSHVWKDSFRRVQCFRLGVAHLSPAPIVLLLSLWQWYLWAPLLAGTAAHQEEGMETPVKEPGGGKKEDSTCFRCQNLSLWLCQD